MRRLLFFIVITAIGMGKGLSQTLIQTYTDRCTGATQVFTVPMNGTTVVAFYNRSRTFTSQDFQNGTLQAWLEETYLWWTSLSPCSTTTTGATATQQTTQQTTQQATQAATNAAANVPPPPSTTTNPTTNAPSTPSSPPTTTETSTPPPTDTSATSNNTSSPDTSTTGADTSSTGNNETSTGGSETSQAETQSSSDQTDTSSTETTESTEQTTESTSSEDTSTEDSSTETSSEDSSTEETSSESEEVETEESSTEESSEESSEETSEESIEEESENQESDEESSEEESDESSEEDSEEETDEEESESDEDEEDNEDDSEEESDDEAEEEDGKKKKKKRALAPPVVMANMLSQQGPDGRYTQAAMFGVSQSSLLGTETYGLNAMIYSNLQQFMLTANYSKVHINKEGRVSRVYSGSLGGMKMFTTYMGMMNHSMVWLGEKGSVKGLAFGTTLTSVELDVREGLIYYDNVLLGTSLTGFYTKPFNFDRLSISPMLAVSSPFWSFDLFEHTQIWNKDVMIIGGSSFTYKLTQRFGINFGVNIIEATIKDFPTLKTFTIGGRLSF